MDTILYKIIPKCMWINTGKQGEKDDDDVLYLKCDTIPNDEAISTSETLEPKIDEILVRNSLLDLYRKLRGVLNKLITWMLYVND
jgi:hypothetical protein